MIYFDNAASAKPCTEALLAFNNCAKNNFANPSALHGAGIEAEKIITAARKAILTKLPSGGKLIFTSGGTESNNAAIIGTARSNHVRKRVLTTSIEHPSVAEPINELERNGFEITRLSPAAGEDFERKIISAVDESVFLLSVMTVNNETGFVIDTAKIYDAVKYRFPRCIIHTDAAQGFLRTPVNGDLISLSAHKIHGLKGVGALFVKDGVNLKPLVYGGGQQNNLRSGTEPTELIAAFGAAVESFKYDREHFGQLNARFLKKSGAIGSIKYDEIIKINSRNNLPNIINFSVRNVKSEILLHFFAENGIYVSSGSACARGKKSAGLMAFGVSEKDADSAIRLSFSAENTIDDIDKFVEVLKAAIERFC